MFRSFHTFDSHAELRGFCIAYETAMKSSASEHHGRDNLAAVAGVEQGANAAAGDDDIIAAASRQQRRHPRVERPQPHAVGAKQNTSSCDYCNWKSGTMRQVGLTAPLGGWSAITVAKRATLKRSAGTRK